MQFQFTPIDYDSFDINGENYIKIIGRDDKNQKVCLVDKYEANFYIILDDKANPEEIQKQIEKTKVEKPSRTTKILRTEILEKNFLGNPVKAIRVFVSNHKDAHDIASEIGDLKGIYARREYDIPIITKYIKEKKLEPLKTYTITGTKITDSNEFGGITNLDIDTCIHIEKIKPAEDKEFIPKILAYDIETTSREIGKDEILMISLYGEKIKKVLTWKTASGAQDYVEFFKDEASMIEKFAEYVRNYKADILTGYFSDGFDLPFLKARADINKVKLSLGLDNRGPTFAKGRIPSGKISGLVHVDIYKFIDAVFSQYLQSETLSLDEVAKELINEEKEDFDFAKLANMKNKDWCDFFSYNIKDSQVTYKLFQKIWPDILEFTKIVKEPIFDVTRDRMATHVENHILHNLDRFNEIAERRPGYNEIAERKMHNKFEGANVFEPTPGFYNDIVMFDFTSMHASLIVSFNISGQTLRLENNGNCHIAPEFELDGKGIQIYFDKNSGFFSTLLSEIVEKRKKFKLEYAMDKNSMKKARSNAYKLLANATFGYQGFFGARYYSREAAASTLAFVRKFNADTMKKIEDKGYKIIAGDTDSIAFLKGDKTHKEILSLLKEINDDLPGIMELDLEGFFPHGLFVAKRGVLTGAKKKYALIDEKGKIKIRGFETVRRDWCGLTRNLQDKVLKMILKDGNEKSALKLVKETIKKLKNRDVEMEDLMIRTQLSRPINEYTTEGPHVIAAKRMQEAGVPISAGILIEYFIGEGSSKRIRDRVHLSGERAKYDIDYYLNNQVIPAIENIFDVFGVDIRSVIDGESQKKLF